MHFLPSHMPHYAPSVSSYSYATTMAPSLSVTSSSNWQSHTPLNIGTGLYLHHEAISHPARNVWGCSGMFSQGIRPTLLHSSSSVSSCLHLCCSNRKGSTAQTLQNTCGTFRASRTTPNSPCMTHQQAQGGSSLLTLGSGTIPVIGQKKVAYNAPDPKMSICHPLCSPVNSRYSQPSLSIQINSDPTHNHPNTQTPIRSSVTPIGYSQYQTSFSSLGPSEVHSSVRTGHNQSQLGSFIASRQKGPVGSSPIHHTQDYTCSVLGEVTNRDFRDSLCEERSDQQIPADQLPLLDMEEIQTPQQ